VSKPERKMNPKLAGLRHDEIRGWRGARKNLFVVEYLEDKDLGYQPINRNCQYYSEQKALCAYEFYASHGHDVRLVELSYKVIEQAKSDDPA